MFMKYYLKALQNYGNFEGRASRAECWYFFLFNCIVAFTVGFIAGFTDVPALSTLYTLALLVPSWAVAVRRIHDVGKSGWFILVPIYSFILLVMKGQEDQNEFGPVPTAE